MSQQVVSKSLLSIFKKTFPPKTQTLKDLKPSVQEKCPQKVIILEKLEYLERRFVYQSFPGPHPV